MLRQRKADAALVDLHMPDVNGLDVLRMVRDADPHCQVILMTGYASIDSAVEAVKLGAMDYLSKPIEFPRLERLLRVVREQVGQRQHLLQSEAQLARDLEFCGMVGRSPLMQDLFGLIRRLAPHLRSALITGETGTGKELVARALHQIGPRADKPFVLINCSTVVETSFETELFGYIAGALPGRQRWARRSARIGGRRHGLPRRSGEPAPLCTSAAPAAGRVRRAAPRRSAGRTSRGRAGRGGHQPRPSRGSGRGPLPERSVLPPQRDRDRAAAVARSP